MITNTMRKPVNCRNHAVSCVLVLMLIAAGSALASPKGATYPSPENINLFRHLDLNSGIDVTAAYANISSGGPQYAASSAINGGWAHAQINFNASAPIGDNSAEMRITLPDAISIAGFTHQYSGNRRADQYRILGSTTGFGGGMTELVGWTSTTSATMTDSFTPTAVQYIQYEFQGTYSDQYWIMQEFLANTDASASIGLYDGYNLTAYKSAEGGPGPITSYDGWIDNPNRIVDGDVHSYLRGNAGGTVDPWFILPLNDTYRLYGVAFGPYPDQSWGSGVTIEITNELTPTGWTEVWTQTAPLNDETILFSEIIDARFLRVTTPITGSGGAVCELEVFASAPIPEPATGLLTVLGGLFLTRRHGPRGVTSA